MKKPELITYQGKRLFFMDFSNMRTTEDINHLISLSKEYIRSQPEKSLLTLTSIQGMHFNMEIKSMFSDFLSGNKPYVRSGAVVGISGLQRIVYNGVMKLTGRDIRSFETLNMAKEWLVSRDAVEV